MSCYKLAGANTVILSWILLFSLLNSMHTYIPHGFLRHFGLWGKIGVWNSRRIGEGGVRQMGKERAGGGSVRNYAKKVNTYCNRKRVLSTPQPHPSPPPPPPLTRWLTKTSNIQHTNVSGRTFKWEALIDLRHNMIEQFGVKRFAQCISCSTGLFWLQWNPVKGQ